MEVTSTVTSATTTVTSAVTTVVTTVQNANYPRRRYKRMPERRSVGIALVYMNKKYGEKSTYKMLMVCKRFTYEFYTVVVGQYNANLVTTDDYLLKMLNKMTVEEKFDILSFNFDLMWYRIWLNACRTLNYAGSKSKFENNFMRDGGARIKRLIARSSNGNRVWTMPKGRADDNESDVMCAVREFGEETNIEKSKYTILPGVVRNYSFVDGNVKYIYTYFVAVTYVEHPVSINWNTVEQTGELCDIRWMGIDEISNLDGRLANFVRPIFHYCASMYRK